MNRATGPHVLVRVASPRPTEPTGRIGGSAAPAAGRQERSRATARDVADLVPCSVATVSLVVNGKAAGRVKPEIEKRVWHAVGQLNYQVNSSASALARKRPNTVALVFPDPTDPFFSMVLDGVLSALGDEFRLNLFAPRTAEDYGPDTVQRAMAGDLAGLIVGRPARRSSTASRQIAPWSCSTPGGGTATWPP